MTVPPRRVFSGYGDSKSNENIDVSHRAESYRGYTVAIMTRESSSSGQVWLDVRAVTDDCTTLWKDGTWLGGGMEDVPETLSEWLPKAKAAIDERADRDGQVRESVESVVTNVFEG